MSVIAHNPILSGFYPDPSICAVGEDFYLVNSTFSYFPGIPIMHSKDLAHWEQIGNACDRISQLPLKDAGHSQGLFAPSIRYHDGTYYVICTNVSHGGNFIVTAKNPGGPWSEPAYIQGAEGIDPSLFFDQDGTCYYIGTHPNPAGCKYDGDWYIWVQELDLKEMKLVGEPKDLWNGSQRDVIWPEGPHLYYKDGYYYIMHAEGGTGPQHAVAVCRSKNLWGPYENNLCNPIFTHRHLGKDYPVKYVGHGDLIQTAAGEWYMVMLAVRPTEGYTTMGRETFLAKVVWEDGWPVVNPGIGILTKEVEIDLKEWMPTVSRNALPGSDRDYHFEKMDALGAEFLFLRNPAEGMYRLTKEKGLSLRLGKETLLEQSSPSYVGIRQQHHSFQVTATLSLTGLSADESSAGLAYVQSNAYHLRLEASKQEAAVILCENGVEKRLGVLPIQEEKLQRKEVTLYLQVEGLKAQAGILYDTKQPIVTDLDVRSLSTEVSGGFVGCTVGMYAVSASDEKESYVDFTNFTYTALNETRQSGQEV